MIRSVTGPLSGLRIRGRLVHRICTRSEIVFLRSRLARKRLQSQLSETNNLHENPGGCQAPRIASKVGRVAEAVVPALGFSPDLVSSHDNHPGGCRSTGHSPLGLIPPLTFGFRFLIPP